MSVSDRDVIDLDHVVAEIEEEVRSKRASGELPSALEHQLDLDFARYAPVGATGNDLDQLLTRVEQRSHIEINPPVTASKPGLGFVKRVMRKLLRWYVRAIGEQMSGYANASTKSMMVMRDRLVTVEQTLIPDEVLRVVELRYGKLFRLPEVLVNELSSILGRRAGRVAHVESGNGWLVQSLRLSGVDAYGVDPTLSLVDEGIAANTEIRVGHALDHLNSVEKGALRAVVLSNATDYLPVGLRNELIEAAWRAVEDEGHVVVASAFPEAWALPELAVVCDLAPSQPFLPATWDALLQEHGFVSCETYQPESIRDGEMLAYFVVGQKPKSLS